MNASSPTVSVVIPSYNRAYCIRAAIDSVLAQTYASIEAIVVDDGSSDGTQDLILAEYGNNQRVRYIFQPNQGVCAARNRGFAESRGEFVALLDSDDAWLPWKIEAQLACLKRFPAAGMVWTDMDAVSEKGAIVHGRFLRTMYSAYRWYPRPENLFTESVPIATLLPGSIPELATANAYCGDIYSQMIAGNLVHTSTVLLRRSRLEQVGTFNVNLRHSGEDYDFHLRTCSYGPVAYIDAPSIHYRWGASDQLTAPEYRIHRARNFINTILPALERDRERIKLPRHILRTTLYGAFLWIGEAALEAGYPDEAALNLMKSLWYYPLQPRTLGLLVLSRLPPSMTRFLRNAYSRAKPLFTQA
ncbi:MAG: glycosyltransferase family 2 protein [Steroidobacteraceae bacterium]